LGEGCIIGGLYFVAITAIPCSLLRGGEEFAGIIWTHTASPE
jgi:hypothetical protein